MVKGDKYYSTQNELDSLEVINKLLTREPVTDESNKLFKKRRKT